MTSENKASGSKTTPKVVEYKASKLQSKKLKDWIESAKRYVTPKSIRRLHASKRSALAFFTQPIEATVKIES